MSKGNGRGSRPRRLRSRKKTAGLGRSFGAFWSVLEIRDAVDFEESESSSYARRAWRSSGNRNLIATL